MQMIRLIFSLSVIVVSFVLYKYLKIDLIKHCELEKCPYCYGTDLCELFVNGNIKIYEDTLTKFFINHFSVKNVLYAKLFEESIVLKKLAHASELQKFDDKNNRGNNRNFSDEILKSLTTKNQQVSNFKVCSKTAAVAFAQKFFSHSSTEENLKHIWTILSLNVEPLLLKILNSANNWPVPIYLGACGRLIAQTDCGTRLNTFENANWFKRAYLAQQLLIAAKNFTFDHNQFRFYLTDVSPDNIAVNGDFKLSFVDLENVILSLKVEGNGVHRSTNYEEDAALFVYSENEICQSSISDHNFYAICKLLLSSNAPWPMMEGGLLHSAPSNYAKELFDSIDLCVIPKGTATRFKAAEVILEMLDDILYLHDF